MIWIQLLPGGKLALFEIVLVLIMWEPPSIAKELSTNADTTSRFDAIYARNPGGEVVKKHALQGRDDDENMHNT